METERAVFDTFVLERSYPAPAERVFSAFSDPAKKRLWFGEGEYHTVEQFEMDFRTGGVERIQSRFNAASPFPGVELTCNGIYQDIVPGRRIVTAATMALGGRVFSASLVTMEIIAGGETTRLICTHQGAFFEGADGPEMRRDGWVKLLARLEDSLKD